MENNEIERLVSIRSELIKSYSKLNKDLASPQTAMMKASETASIIERAVTQLDEVLLPYVKFS
tara:strand:+ start:943 stop:1131 length:189 start_codon:yes stop_codon:yes gene_type:complete